MNNLERTRAVPLEILLTITTDCAMTTNGMDVVRTVEWMVAEGDTLAFALPAAIDAAKDCILQQYPSFPTKLFIEDLPRTKEAILPWLASQKELWGETLLIEQKVFL